MILGVFLDFPKALTLLIIKLKLKSYSNHGNNIMWFEISHPKSYINLTIRLRDFVDVSCLA